MPTAEKKTKIEKVEKIVIEEKEVSDGVLLHLTDEEAQLLRDFSGNIGGFGKLRKLMSAIFDRLNDCGYTKRLDEYKIDYSNSLSLYLNDKNG